MWFTLSNFKINIMKKDIMVGVISAMFGALIVFIVSSSLGLFNKTISDSQIQEIAKLIVDKESYRDVILEKMVKSKEFIGPKGDVGPQGKTGSPGKSDQDKGIILSMIIVKNGKVERSTNGVTYDSKNGIVTFPNPQNLKHISIVSDYGASYITETHYLRNDFEAINKFKVWKKALDTGGAERAYPPSSFCALTIALR